MTGHDTEHKGIIMTITEDADMDPKPYILTAISIGLEGAATGNDALYGDSVELDRLVPDFVVDTDIHAWIDRKTERQRKRNALQDHQSGETTR